jgi:starch synthase
MGNISRLVIMVKRQKISNGVKVLFVASECAPIAKVGGLGDVIGSLPKALKDLGIDVRICLPKYAIVDFKKYKFELINRNIKVKDEKVKIYQGFLPESDPRSIGDKVPVYLLENEKYFGENGVYFEKSAFVSSLKEIERFLFLSQAALKIFPILNWFPQIIHCHDWHTAIVPMALKIKHQKPSFHLWKRGRRREQTSLRPAKIKNIKSLLTIHNLANQGKWNPQETLSFFDFKDEEINSLKTRGEDGNFNIFQQGILNADLINAVSPTYAKEILTKEYGEGLEKFLLRRKKELFGILNGIDEKRFNPETDPALKVNYSYQNLERKIENKTHLQEILNFKKNPEIPLFAFIGRLTSQKGIDLIIEIIPELVKMGCQLVILGVGNPDYEKKLLELSQKYPQNVSAQIKFDPVLAQKIYGGSDFILIPSRFEPCGLVQMIAMTYGTIPIARKTGGLADTIEDGKTGFLFKKYEAKSFLETIKKALNLYQNKEKWQKLIEEAMKKDFSWQKSAQKYLKLYKKLLKLNRFYE